MTCKRSNGDWLCGENSQLTPEAQAEIEEWRNHKAELPRRAIVGHWVCDGCGEVNDGSKLRCRGCGLPEEEE